jgi:hypothetical protein
MDQKNDLHGYAYAFQRNCPPKTTHLQKKAITFEQLEELFPNHHGLQRSPMRPQFPRRLVWFLTVWTGGVKAAQEMI